MSEAYEKIEELEGMYSKMEKESEAARALRNQIIEEKKQYFKKCNPYDRVQYARAKDRFTALDIIEELTDTFIELKGDRLYSDDRAVVAGLATIGKYQVTVIAGQKGRTTEENIERNFGMIHPEGYRKAIRLAKQAEKFGRAIIYLVDTPGAYCGISAEERGEGEAIAQCLFTLPALRVPQITCILSEGGSGGALAFSVTDRVYMLENAVYSILSPEGFASILWKDSTKAKQAAKLLRLTSHDLYEDGVIDGILSESYIQEETIQMIAKDLRTRILKDLDQLFSIHAEKRYERRYEKYRTMTHHAYRD